VRVCGGPAQSLPGEFIVGRALAIPLHTTVSIVVLLGGDEGGAGVVAISLQGIGMRNAMFRVGVSAVATSMGIVLAGCSSPRPHAKPKPSPAQVVCRPAQAGDQAVGTWLSEFHRKGVAGRFRVLFALSADGTMRYEDQIKRAGKPPQGLEESGCWSRDGGTLVLRTTKSNGVPVEAGDPIYTNRYTVVSQSARTLVLRGENGVLKASRMSPGYRLPY
jgi:hypothetical protein